MKSKPQLALEIVQRHTFLKTLRENGEYGQDKELASLLDELTQLMTNQKAPLNPEEAMERMRAKAMIEGVPR